MDGAPGGQTTGPAAPDEAADPAPYGPEAASLRLLRRLVTTLTVVMIASILAVVALLVIRMPSPGDLLSVPVPPELDLPEGAVPTAFTRGRTWFAVVTEDERILVFGADGTLRREVRLRDDGG